LGDVSKEEAAALEERASAPFLPFGRDYGPENDHQSRKQVPGSGLVKATLRKKKSPDSVLAIDSDIWVACRDEEHTHELERAKTLQAAAKTPLRSELEEDELDFCGGVTESAATTTAGEDTWVQKNDASLEDQEVKATLPIPSETPKGNKLRRRFSRPSIPKQLEYTVTKSKDSDDSNGLEESTAKSCCSQCKVYEEQIDALEAEVATKEKATVAQHDQVENQVSQSHLEKYDKLMNRMQQWQPKNSPHLENASSNIELGDFLDMVENLLIDREGQNVQLEQKDEEILRMKSQRDQHEMELKALQAQMQEVAQNRKQTDAELAALRKTEEGKEVEARRSQDRKDDEINKLKNQIEQKNKELEQLGESESVRKQLNAELNDLKLEQKRNQHQHKRNISELRDKLAKSEEETRQLKLEVKHFECKVEAQGVKQKDPPAVPQKLQPSSEVAPTKGDDGESQVVGTSNNKRRRKIASRNAESRNSKRSKHTGKDNRRGEASLPLPSTRSSSKNRNSSRKKDPSPSASSTSNSVYYTPMQELSSDDDDESSNAAVKTRKSNRRSLAAKTFDDSSDTTSTVNKARKTKEQGQQPGRRGSAAAPQTESHVQKDSSSSSGSDRATRSTRPRLRLTKVNGTKKPSGSLVVPGSSLAITNGRPDSQRGSPSSIRSNSESSTTSVFYL